MYKIVQNSCVNCYLIIQKCYIFIQPLDILTDCLLRVHLKHRIFFPHPMTLMLGARSVKFLSDISDILIT